MQSLLNLLLVSNALLLIIVITLQLCDEDVPLLHHLLQMLNLALLRRPLRLERLDNRRELGLDLGERVLLLDVHLDLSL